MEHSTARRLIRAATLFILVLTTTSGVAVLELMTTGSAMAGADGPSGGSAQRFGADPPSTPTPTPAPIPAPTPTPVPSMPFP